MDFNAILGAITGEAGAFTLLLLVVFWFMSGRLISKSMFDKVVDDLKEENDDLTESFQVSAAALDKLTRTTEESLENSKTTLRILDSARRTTGITGEVGKDNESI